MTDDLTSEVARAGRPLVLDELGLLLRVVVAVELPALVAAE